jgi:hypothetical protein
VARRQSRRRSPGQQQAPSSDYADAEGNVLTLRGSLTPGTRRRYAETLAGRSASAASTPEDAWHLAVRWVISGLPIERQRELLGRLRMASTEERAWVRETLRAHCAEHFPDVQAP